MQRSVPISTSTPVISTQRRGRVEGRKRGRNRGGETGFGGDVNQDFCALCRRLDERRACLQAAILRPLPTHIANGSSPDN